MKVLNYAAVLLAMAAVSCNQSGNKGGVYTLDAQVDSTMNGTMAYVINYDNGDKLDSVIVADGKVHIESTVESPVLARLVIDGNRYGTLVVEPGNIVVGEDRLPSGTALNTQLVKYEAASDSLMNLLYTCDNDSLKTVYEDSYNTLINSTIEANGTNPVGYFAFLNVAYDFTKAELDSVLGIYPDYGNYQRIAKIVEGKVREAETGPGKPFADFEIKGDSVQRLSDYAGKGKYLLVDFWASWCGPCRREMPVIKELYEEFGPQGLDVLGVAVWDEKENSEKAIEQLQLPWPQILNAQTVPTDLYGIIGIPHIMLIDPNGTIVARGMQGEELKRVVREAMTAPAPEAKAAETTSADDSSLIEL